MSGRNRPLQHQHWVAPHQAGVHHPGSRGEAELLGPIGGGHQHRSGAIGDLRRRSCGVDAVGPGHRLEGGQSLQGGLPHTLVGAHGDRLIGLLAVLIQHRCLDGHNLGLEPTLGPGPGRPLLGSQAETVALLPGDAPLVGHPLGPLKLGCELVLGEVVAGHRAAHPVGRRVRPDGHDAHALHPTGQHGVFHSGFHQAVAQVYRVLRRAALGVHRAARRFLRQPGGEPGGAGDVHGLGPDLVDAAAHHLADGRGIDARPLHRGRLHLAEQPSGMNRRQTTVSLANWRANGFDDDDLSHRPTIELSPQYQPVEASLRPVNKPGH